MNSFFDRVNHDKLIQILREQVNDSTTLNLIRKYLKAGVMEKGLEKATITGVPQGGPLSVVCSNVYLDKLDKELEQRGLRFTRYADDVLIFTKSEIAANRVMKSICSWLERKLFLKVNATKTKVVRPTRGKYLGFTFLKNGSEWKVRPTNEKKKKVKKKLSEYLKRGKAIARPLAVTIKRVNEIVRGWINYFRIGMMKLFLEEFGEWLRHKIRVIVMKQWKSPKTIYRNLSYLNWKHKNGFSDKEIFKVANSRLGWYKRSGMNVVNFIISKDLLENRIKDGAGLLKSLILLLSESWNISCRAVYETRMYGSMGGARDLFSLYPIALLCLDRLSTVIIRLQRFHSAACNSMSLSQTRSHDDCHIFCYCRLHRRNPDTGHRPLIL